MKKKLPSSPSRQKNKKLKTVSFPIVAIGASAGGLEAMSELLRNLTGNTGMAYVYIQHLSPDHDSMLSSILANSSKMKVLEAKDKMQIRPDHVYIIPPNKEMAVVGGQLKVSPRLRGPDISMPINHFFSSLAKKENNASIGVILSGNASDGTLGLKAIKMAGGLTFAQDASAKFQSMPKSATAEGVVDMVLSPREIAKKLIRISRNKNILYSHSKNIPEQSIASTEEDLTETLLELKKTTGVDFSHYKQTTIRRRIMRRMLLNKLDTVKAYVQFMKGHHDETTILYQDLLINVTQFFRDPDAVEFLKRTLFPRIIKSKEANEPIRIWVPACSTGQEAYSFAIMLMELLSDKATKTIIQIFATDLSETVINKARMGVYSKADVMNISPKRLQRFFISQDGHYRIIKEIRDLCIFATHNMSKDPPFSKLDFISCCNLMIYLDVGLQKKLIATFHYALKNNGYLMLGKSETVGNSSHLFTNLDKKFKIYSKKKDSSANALFEMSSRLPKEQKVEMRKIQKPFQAHKSEEVNLENSVDKALLEKYVPPSVVVNEDLDIILFRGSTSLYLEHAPGKASFNLLKMARSGLGYEIRNAIHKAKKIGHVVKKSGLEIGYNGKIHQVSVEVVPIKNPGGNLHYLIVFEDGAQPSSDVKHIPSKDQRVKQLEKELSTMHEEMRSIAEGKEADNEELQSANEEIISSNEELQSMNEELETSKEELESTNEELITINQELQVRNEQLAELQEYSDAVITTVRESLIILDKDLRVRSANSSFYKTFHTKEEDTEGRLLYELGNKQWDIHRLRQLLEEILPGNSQFTDFEVTHNFPGIGEKVMLLNARRVERRIHGQQLILLAIKDITEHKQIEKILAGREAWFQNMADNAPVMIWVAGLDKLYSFCNKNWLEYRGLELELVVGQSLTEGVHPDDAASLAKTYNSSFQKKIPFIIEFRLKRHDGQYRWVLNKAKPNFTPEGQFTGYLGSCVEIHDQRILNEELEERVRQRTHALHEMNLDLKRSNNELQQFAYVASHDLQEPLRKIVTFTDRLKERYQEILPAAANDYFNKITVSSQRMTQLIDDLLNFSQISRFGKEITVIDLKEIIQNVLTDFDLLINEKKAKVSYEEFIPIQAIPLQMHQLFFNLMSNSLKFNRFDVPPIIEISCHKLPPVKLKRFPELKKSLSYCEIIFKDNGIGFSKEYVEQIFIIFQRLHDKQQFSGTGIGLALCRKIVNNHNGQIFAVSKENVGSEFHIILPLVQPASNEV